MVLTPAVVLRTAAGVAVGAACAYFLWPAAAPIAMMKAPGARAPDLAGGVPGEPAALLRAAPHRRGPGRGGRVRTRRARSLPRPDPGVAVWRRRLG